jgi:hypothetical protein
MRVPFHCGIWARSFLPDIRVGTAPISGSMLGERNTEESSSAWAPAEVAPLREGSREGSGGVPAAEDIC